MKGRPCPPLYPRGWNTAKSALSGRYVWIKTATPRTGSEQGQKNTGKGEKGKKAKPEKVFTLVHKVEISFRIVPSILSLFPDLFKHGPHPVLGM
jgi:hypothetical protein